MRVVARRDGRRGEALEVVAHRLESRGGHLPPEQARRIDGLLQGGLSEQAAVVTSSSQHRAGMASSSASWSRHHEHAGSGRESMPFTIMFSKAIGTLSGGDSRALRECSSEEATRSSATPHSPEGRGGRHTAQRNMEVWWASRGRVRTTGEGRHWLAG